ncbi:MAG: (2Fe-2S) ferredoxin domain-containing protein [Clostridia bacterium]|nr:(2Fe-2S) ferredoxin domain-containing protein [Clostridia bacterium]
MKSLAELAAIREKMKAEITLEGKPDCKRVVVGMATCGIAAGATPVLEAFVEGVKDAGIGENVSVKQTGCVGICQYEPVAEVYDGDVRTTYVKMDAEKAKRIVAEHLVGGNIVTEYTIGATEV